MTGDTRRRQSQLGRLRRDLVASGVPRDDVTWTPDTRLGDLARRVEEGRLALVPDVDEALIEDTVPNLRFRPRLVSDDTPDEAESTRFFVLRELGAKIDDVDVRSTSLGPWGGDAA